MLKSEIKASPKYDEYLKEVAVNKELTDLNNKCNYFRRDIIKLAVRNIGTSFIFCADNYTYQTIDYSLVRDIQELCTLLSEAEKELHEKNLVIVNKYFTIKEKEATNG